MNVKLTTREKILLFIAALPWAVGPMFNEFYIDGNPVVKTTRTLSLAAAIGVFLIFRLNSNARSKKDEAEKIAKEQAIRKAKYGVQKDVFRNNAEPNK